MLDIVVMLFHILRAYLPAELKWSVSRAAPRRAAPPLRQLPTMARLPTLQGPPPLLPHQRAGCPIPRVLLHLLFHHPGPLLRASLTKYRAGLV